MKKSVWQTLCYFDLFGHPLTKEELFANLWQPPKVNYEEFLNWLDGNCHPERSEGSLSVGQSDRDSSVATLPQNDKIKCKFGYYFLPGKEEIVENRRRRLLYAEAKMKIARRAAKKIRSVPFLRAVFVCNNVGALRAEEDSDIDMFVIASAGRMWLVRFFANIILRLFGLRTYGAKTKDRVCLSFFVDSEHLSLSNLRALPDDIHFAYWLHEMVPVYDPENLYGKFLKANSWTKEFLPNLRPASSSNYIFAVKDSAIGRVWKKMWETMWRGAYGGILENQAKSFQLIQMKPSVKEKMNNGDRGVVVEDGVIKLHENDRRLEYKKKWEERLRFHGFETDSR